MMTLLLVLLALGITVLYLKSQINYKDGEDLSDLTPTKVGKTALLGAILLLVAFIQPFSVERVDAGHVGVKVSLAGDNRGVGKFEYKTGWVVINTWVSKLYEFPTFQQNIEYDKYDVTTLGGFPTTIHPTFNYSIKPGSVGDMFSNLRLSVKEMEQGWLKNAILGSLNDVTNRWTVDNIFTQREKYEQEIIAETNKRLSKWFEISQLRTNITPPPALVASITAKTQAIQEVQVAENKKKVVEANGYNQIAKPKADSASKVIDAAADAEVIRLKQLTLTPIYVDYLKVNKWDGVLPTVQAGGNGLMLNIPR